MNMKEKIMDIMNIKKKIREFRINRFVNECKKDRLNYEVYCPKLYNIDKFPKLIRKINRLKPIEKEYVLSPVKSMKNILNGDDVYTIMKNQLDIINKRHENNIVDLSKLYLSTVHVSKDLYQEIVNAYVNNRSIGEYQAKDYIDMFVENQLEFFLYGPTHDKISINGLAPNKLKQTLKHNPYGLKFLSVYNNLSEEERKSLNDMNELEFQKVLDFTFAEYDDYDLHSRKKLLIECGDISEKIDSLRLFPDYLIYFFSFDCNKPSKRKFLNSINKNSVNWIRELSTTPKIHSHCIKKLIKKGDILKLPCKNLEEIFKSVRKNGTVNEMSIERYKTKMDFLIGDCDKKGFAFEVKDIEYLKEALKFICQNDSPLVLNQKFNALNMLKKEIKNNQIDFTLYSKYLSFLNEGLENKTEKEKIRQIKARSRYFKDHDLSDFIEQLQNKPQREKLEELLRIDQTPKKMEQSCKFISISDNYKSEIVNSIVDFLAEIEDVQYSKMVLSYVKSEQFKNLSLEDQKEKLTILIDMLKNEERNKDKSNSNYEKKKVA